MIDCVMIGDTIATNLNPVVKCAEVRSAPNLTSSRIIDIAGGGYHRICVVSAGSYDTPNPSYSNFKQIRGKSACKFYVWVSPVDPGKAADISKLARQNPYDTVVTFTPGTDKLTPSDYNILGNKILNIMDGEQ